MKMKENKFYILIPVYNVEQYIDDCICSLLSQNYKEYEVILVDDGSKDDSGKICDKYADAESRIHVVHKKNGGQLSARLAAIDYIRQNCNFKDTYTIFVDSDDELKKGALETINQKILLSECDMLIYGYEKFDTNGIYYTTLEEKTKEIKINDMSELFREVLIEHGFNSLCRKAVKTEMLFFDVDDSFKSIQMGEDLLQSLSIYKQNPCTLIIPDILYRYRTNPNGSTQKINIKRFSDDLLSRQYTVEMIEELGIWNESDFEKYFKKCFFALNWAIRSIIKESASWDEALDNLGQMHAHSFVQEYCLERTSGKLNIWLRGFFRKHFRTLLFFNTISNLKNVVKEKITGGK